jgi:NAD(P)-dependent dehydrogenase (short-subunit alcohol dehydrogenase family)
VGGLAIACDVGKEDQINALVAETEGAFGPIDIFFSNAAVATGRGPLNTDIDVWFDQWDINVMSHVYAVRAVLPAMLKRGEGYLIHTASMAGVLSSHGNLPYAVTKHAVVGLAEWLAFTYRHKGIRTSLLAPLGVRTPMLDTSSAFAESAVGPIKEPGDVAAMVTDAVEAERFMILTDQIAQKWMSGKTDDIERWLSGMNRLQEKIEAK